MNAVRKGKNNKMDEEHNKKQGWGFTEEWTIRSLKEYKGTYITGIQ
jgi:hypothetical protein